MFRRYKVAGLSAVSIFILGGLTYLAAHHYRAEHGQARLAEPMSSVQSRASLQETKEQTRLRVQEGYGNLPLSFEPNRGQSDARVKFLSRARNRTLWLTSDEAVLAVGRPQRVTTRDAGTEQAKQAAPAVLRMKFVAANANPQITGEEKQLGTVNYFSGNPEQWRTKIPTYARVRYRSLYPGIDLVFYGTNRELEYDLVVSPGADPGQIRLALAGAQKIRIDNQGNLVLETSAGNVIQQKPKIYQRQGTTLTAVAGNYVIAENNEIGFRLGNYDRRAAVVIDPVLRYASYLAGGGDENDVGTGIAVDTSNRAVVAGATLSHVFPGEEGSPAPGFSAFVTKLDFTGSTVVFTAFVLDDDVNHHDVALALDAGNNIYLAGIAPHAGAVSTTPGAFQTSFGGATDAWVAKLNSTGTKLIYLTLLGGGGVDEPFGIDVDSAGNAYVTGSTTSKNFPVTPGAFQRECKLKNDGSCASAFVTKLNALGTRALYSSYLGGHGAQSGQGIVVNAAGNAFVTGQTDAKDFPTTAGTEQPVLDGGRDAFVTQFSTSGSHLNFSTFLGGSSTDAATAIALDSAGNAFVTGSTESTDFPIKNAFRPRCTGGCSFVSKLSPSLRLLYSTFLGNGGGTSIAVTAGGQAFIAGDTGANFQTTQNAFQRVLPPIEGGGITATRSIFITKLTPTGLLSYASFLGGDVEAPRVALDRSANAYLTGTVGFPPFGTIPVTPGAFQTERIAELDAFVAKVVPLCALSSVNRSVTICSPANGATVKSPVNIVAGTTDVTPVKLTQVYLDGKKIFEARLSAINVNLPIAGGTHRLTVQAFDTNNVIFKKTVNITVGP